MEAEAYLQNHKKWQIVSISLWQIFVINANQITRQFIIFLHGTKFQNQIQLQGQ